MKFKLSLKDKEISMEADVEKLAEKRMEQKEKHPPKKTRYQIRMEEKRKSEELRHKQQMQYLFILLGIAGVCLIVGIIATILNI